ncbi:MAG: murein biosynthesis integral membrane protein MurJ [Patescibacteria group bacterium]
MKLNIKNIFNHQSRTVNSAALIIAGVYFASAVLGIFRDRLLAAKFGAGNELDIYYASFRIPDFISTVLIIGAIAAAIVPIFSQYLVRSRKEAFDFLANLLNVFLISLTAICGLLIVFAPQVIPFIAPGFLGEKKELAILLTRIMLLSPFLLGISNIISAILRIFRRFVISSLSPVMYNLGIILGILFFVPKFGLKGLAFGVVLGGALHLLIQLPVLFSVGFRPLKIINFKQKGLKEVVKLTIPRSIGLAATQINLIVVNNIASLLASGSIAVLNLAESLSRPLFTFIAVSYSTAAFPVLAMAFSQKNKKKFSETFNSTINKIFYLLLLLSFLFFIFRDFIVRTVFQTGKFNMADANLTAACFGLFCLGIFAQGLVNFIAKAFYAVSDTKTPAVTSVAGMAVNVIFCLLLVKIFSFPNFFQQIFVNFFNLANRSGVEVLALPLAISLSAIFQCFLLIIFYRKKKILIFSQKLNEPH